MHNNKSISFGNVKYWYSNFPKYNTDRIHSIECFPLATFPKNPKNIFLREIASNLKLKI